MNDESKRLMIRYKKSKDFYKTNEKLRKEGYYVVSSSLEDKGIVVNGVQTNEKLIMVGRKGQGTPLITISYYDTPDEEYKQTYNYINY